MSTIASPRPSISLSSRRTSTSTDRSASISRQPTTGPGPATGSLRRNRADRAALRDYYGLQTTSKDAPPPTPTLDAETETELDKPGFDAYAYVSSILTREGLEGVMRVEASLISEIRTLDGEKKALVYDNYSKLIAATETIRKMRTSMEPLAPMTRTLEADVGSVAERARELLEGLRRAHGGGEDEGMRRARKQREGVRWVLKAPERLERMVGDGKMDQAEAEWEVVEGLLGKWEGVKGVDAVRQGCLAALHRDET